MKISTIAPVALLVLCAAAALAAEDGKPDHQKGRPKQPSQNSTCNNVPAHPYDIILGRPTRDSITASVLLYQDGDGYIAYGTQPGKYTRQTPRKHFAKAVPVEVVITSLHPNTQYFYQLRVPRIHSYEGTFHTQRPRGSPFTFTIIADSHLDDRVDPRLYQRTLANALADAPDFTIDLGDTFMTEKHDSRANAARQYLAQRYYYGQICGNAPLFFVLGNHDGESPRGHGGAEDDLAVWSNLIRKKYFPNPIPDSFYTGNGRPSPGRLAGRLLCLDLGRRPVRGPRSLLVHAENPRQRRQLEAFAGGRSVLLAQTHFRNQQGQFKFLFIHHLAGGGTPEARGGVEAAGMYEWGGKNPDGSDGFRQNRPGWPAPIHQLMLQNHVTALFHGHDHLYVKQDLDGIVYQECPQPGDPRGNTRTAEEYGYKSGVLLGSSGHMRVRVSASTVTVEYVRACLPGDERSAVENRAVAACST